MMMIIIIIIIIIISNYYVKVSGIPSGNKFIKTIRYPHM